MDKMNSQKQSGISGCVQVDALIPQFDNSKSLPFNEYLVIGIPIVEDHCLLPIDVSLSEFGPISDLVYLLFWFFICRILSWLLSLLSIFANPSLM